MDFAEPYRGSPVVPHASERFFGQYFIAVMGATALLSFPGRGPLPEVRPARLDRDRAVRMVQAARVSGLARAGGGKGGGRAPPKSTAGVDPRAVSGADKRGWTAFQELAWWRSWAAERMGPAYPSSG